MFLACFSHLGNVEMPRVTNTAAIPALTSHSAHLLAQSSSPRLQAHKALQPASSAAHTMCFQPSTIHKADKKSNCQCRFATGFAFAATKSI